MLFGAQIGLLVYGIIAMIRGQYSVGKGKKVIGSKARLLGAICLAPLPLSMIVGIVIGITSPQAVAAGSLKGLIAGIEISILVGTIIAVVVLAKTFYKQQQSVTSDAV